MFKYYFFCFSNFTVESYADIYLDNGKTTKHFTLEPCELGKNINIKHKEVIEKFEAIERWKLEDFYCINYNGSNATLYSHPSITNEYEPSLEFKIYANAECEDYLTAFKLVTENDIIDHTKKDNPIVPFYQKNDFSILNEEKKNCI